MIYFYLHFLLSLRSWEGASITDLFLQNTNDFCSFSFADSFQVDEFFTVVLLILIVVSFLLFFFFRSLEIGIITGLAIVFIILNEHAIVVITAVFLLILVRLIINLHLKDSFWRSHRQLIIQVLPILLDLLLVLL